MYGRTLAQKTLTINNMTPIPSCLTLTDAQRAKLEEFSQNLPPITMEEHDAEFGSVVITSRLIFSCYDTSIGFNLYVEDAFTGKKVSLLTEEDINNL